ncbi:MAG: GHKL domain-containing protein [Xanthomonadaceae bacterium]|nr:GHKL domain-containing protein [Xanthomonadaceae bacterium]
MLDTVFQFFKQWANLGVHKGQPLHVQKVTLLTNIIAIPTFITAVASSVALASNGHPNFIALSIGVFTVISQLVFWSLHSQKNDSSARYTFIISQQGSLLATCLFYPKEIGMEPYWFNMIIFSHLLFDSKELKSKIFFVSTALACTILSMLGYLQIHSMIIPIEAELLAWGAKFHVINATIYFLLSTSGFSAMNYYFEQKLQENELQILQSNKLASLGEISGGIAHEINNPLSIIIGRTELLKSKIEQSSVTNEYLIANLTNILQTSRRIAKVIYGLKKFARSSSQEPKSDHLLIDVVNDTLILSQEKLKSQGIEVETRGIENTSVYCNNLQLSQVLYNLISNSAEHMKVLSEKWIRIEAKHTKHHVEILVIDSGRGIPKKVAAKIMDPFFTTKEVGSGIGMGLSISHGIISQEGGELLYDPNYPNTTFVIRLPKHNASDQSLKSVA